MTGDLVGGLLDDIVIAPADPNEDDGRNWPHQGQDFEIFVAALDDGDKLLLVLIELPAEVSNVMGELGNGDYMTDWLFGGILPDAVGLWKCQVKFFCEPHTDWESGNHEDEYGFEILSKEKL